MGDHTGFISIFLNCIKLMKTRRKASGSATLQFKVFIRSMLSLNRYVYTYATGTNLQIRSHYADLYVAILLVDLLS